MLKVKAISSELNASIELDDYIPLTIRWGENSSELKLQDPPSLFWTIGIQNSLLEISINSESGFIRTLKVILAGEITLECSNKTIDPKIPMQKGTPILNTTSWSSTRRLREDKEFAFYIDGSHLLIVLSQEEIVSRVESSQIQFGLNQDNCLCAVQVNDFTDSDISLIKSTLARQKMH